MTYTGTLIPGLTIDSGCPGTPSSLTSCRTIVVPNKAGSYPFLFMITFYGDQIKTLNSNVDVRCPSI